MKRILLMVSLLAPPMAVALYFIIGATASIDGVPAPIPSVTDSTDEERIPMGENGAPGSPQGVMPLSNSPFEISSYLFSQPASRSGNSWPFEPTGPLGYSYPAAQAITWGFQENPPVVPDLSMVQIGGGSSIFEDGGHSPLFWAGSSPIRNGGVEEDGGRNRPDRPPTNNPDSPAPVPESGTLVFLGAGLATLLLLGKRLEKARRGGDV